VCVKGILRLSILAVCGASAAVSAATDLATISGRAVVTKVLTKKRVTMPSYQLRGASVDPREPETSRKDPPVVDELSRVVIYLEGSGLASGTPTKDATLTQRNQHFDPEIVVIPVGSTVSFPNADPIFHNIFSLSKVKQFDLGYYAAGQTRTITFDRPGVVEVYCHLHANMSAAILVLATAFWTRPAPDGTFSLPSISPGTYDLVAWHRSAGFFRRRVTVSGGETLAVDLAIPLRDQDPNAERVAGSER
jgi:plastocyanin